MDVNILIRKMMETTSSDSCPIESPPSPAPTKINSKIGRIKIRTPAEINKEFEDTPNSAAALMSVDSPDRLRAFSFEDFLRPPNPSPSLPTVSQLKEPSAKVVKPKRKSKYNGFGETTPSDSPSVPVVLTVSSAKVVKPKRKSKYPGFGETILLEKIQTSTKPAIVNLGTSVSFPQAFEHESSSWRETQEKVGANLSSSSKFKVNLAQYQVTPRCTITESYPTPSALTRSSPNASSVTPSFATPSSVISYSSSGSVSTSCPASVSTSRPASVSTSRPASVSTSCPASVSTSRPASVSTSRPAKSVPNEAGSGLRRNYPGGGETAIRSHPPGNLLNEHQVSDTDARNISASWQKLKPTEVSTSVSVSNSSTAGSSSNSSAAGSSSNSSAAGSSSNSSAAGSSSNYSAAGSSSNSSAVGSNCSQLAQYQVGESYYSRFKVILPKPQDSPKLPKPQKLDKVSKQTGFHLPRENPSSFSVAANSTSVSFSQVKSAPNKPDLKQSNIRKKYRGFGEITTSEDFQVIEKSQNKRRRSSDNKTAKNSQKKYQEVWKTVKPATVHQKVVSKSTSSIRKLDEISKPCEEDWDSSLREWIPRDQDDHVQKRKVKPCRKFVTKSGKSQANKNKSDAGVFSRFEKTNQQQAKIQKSRKRKSIYISEENSPGSPTSIAYTSAESTLEPSECTEKMDENDNNTAQQNFEEQNNYNYNDMNTDTDTADGYDDIRIDTDTEDGGRKKLLDGVVLTISGYENPLRGRIVRKAVAMGATFSEGWTSDCSHLVCGFIGTFKYLQAKGRGKIVLGTWIEDCYKSKKKVDWMEYILSEKKADTEPVEETSIPSDGLRFLPGMEVRVKESYLFNQFAGKAGFVRGAYSDSVQVTMQGCGQLHFHPTNLKHILPEIGDKAKYVMKGQGEKIMEVHSVDEGRDIAVVRCDGHKGEVVRLNRLCRVSEDAIV